MFLLPNGRLFLPSFFNDSHIHVEHRSLVCHFVSIRIHQQHFNQKDQKPYSFFVDILRIVDGFGNLQMGCFSIQLLRNHCSWKRKILLQLQSKLRDSPHGVCLLSSDNRDWNHKSICGESSQDIPSKNAIQLQCLPYSKPRHQITFITSIIISNTRTTRIRSTTRTTRICTTTSSTTTKTTNSNACFSATR